MKVEPLNENVVPEGEGPMGDPITIRFPRRLLERIESCAQATQNNRTDTIHHLVRWALTQYEANAGVPAKKKGTA